MCSGWRGWPTSTWTPGTPPWCSGSRLWPRHTVRFTVAPAATGPRRSCTRHSWRTCCAVQGRGVQQRLWTWPSRCQCHEKHCIIVARASVSSSTEVLSRWAAALAPPSPRCCAPRAGSSRPWPGACPPCPAASWQRCCRRRSSWPWGRTSSSPWPAWLPPRRTPRDGARSSAGLCSQQLASRRSRKDFCHIWTSSHRRLPEPSPKYWHRRAALRAEEEQRCVRRYHLPQQ
mmetsp:Transcript_42136/g.133774  ORF Transcript_42136/g.133774 Transcript_42136/m.133774 type:complete len:230 (+) Transcript_42136:945-1634(+)